MSPILEMRNIAKHFGPVKALSDVSFSVEPGEIHALCGENGAGKSTLMKILSGVYPAGSYDGQIVFDGEERRFADINSSEALGIIIIHQELALIPLLSVQENIFITHPPGRFGIIDRDSGRMRARDLMRQVGLTEPPETLVTHLGVAKQQLVEIAKALSKKVRLLILDEPTASLNERDSAALLDLLLAFKAEGLSSILISHKLNEISRVADRITVLRDGRSVGTIDCRNGPADEDEIIRLMVNRDLEHRYPPHTPKTGEMLMEVQDWSAWHPLHADRQVIRDVDFHVRAGEIVGIAGLMGAGRTEFAMSLFGRSFGTRISGRVTMRGQPVDVSTVSRAIAAGLAYVTEDRKELGLHLSNEIRHNISLAELRGIARHGVIDEIAELRIAQDYRNKMRIRSPDVQQLAGKLSGGNQQKVVLSKWMFTNPDVLILDEPTRGIDVGAKYEIYALIQQMADSGRGCVVISSEMPELLGICDRICVMNEGRFVGEFTREEATQEKIMRAIVRSTSETHPIATIPGETTQLAVEPLTSNSPVLGA